MIRAPLQLTNPEFVLIPDAARLGAYKVGIPYVPDPDQRFTSKVNPSAWVNSSFGLEVSEAGGISTATVKITDQTVPAMKAVGGSIPGLVGAWTLAPGGSSTDPENACERHESAAGMLKCAVTKCEVACPKQVERIVLLIDDKGPDKGDVLAALYGRDFYRRWVNAQWQVNVVTMLPEHERDSGEPDAHLCEQF